MLKRNATTNIQAIRSNSSSSSTPSPSSLHNKAIGVLRGKEQQQQQQQPISPRLQQGNEAGINQGFAEPNSPSGGGNRSSNTDGDDAALLRESNVNAGIINRDNNQQQPQQSEEIPRRLVTPSAGLALHEFAPRIVVVGIGGAGGNALNNMIAKNLEGVDFLALNTDAQHLATTLTDQRIQLGVELTRGLGCGANPEAGRMAAEESREIIREKLEGAHLVFITAGMGGGTGTGAAPIVADICYQLGILTVGVVTLPFFFEGTHRKKLALEGIDRMQGVCDTLITIPNQNLFKLSGPKTPFAEAFQMADDVLLGGVKSITDLMTKPGLINLDFADVQTVMVGMGNAILGTGTASHPDKKTKKSTKKKRIQLKEDLDDDIDVANENRNEDDDAEEEEDEEDDYNDRAERAARIALENPLLGTGLDISSAKGMLVNITGGRDMTLFEVDRAAQLITEKVDDENANIIFGSAFDERLDGSVRVSVVATGIVSHTEGTKKIKKEEVIDTKAEVEETIPDEKPARKWF